MEIYVYAHESAQANQDALDRQVKKCVDYASERFGSEHDIYSFTDLGDERSGFDLLMKRLGDADVVVAMSPDRFTRDQAEFKEIKGEIALHGAKLVFVKRR
mgnify:CR=1 FL=1